MPQPVARVGDTVFCPADIHNTPSGPVPMPVTGQIVAGVPTVLTGGSPTARLGDPGVHAVCLGPNNFTILTASLRVFAASQPVARMGDTTQHCTDVPGTSMGTILTGAFTVLSE